MSLHQVVSSTLKQRFADRPITYHSNGPNIATIRFPHGRVGPITIVDDQEEITIYINNATHGHLTCYEESFSEAQKEAYICNQVCELLDALFQDRLVVFTLFSGFAGGWTIYSSVKEIPSFSIVWRRFTWTRPL